MQSIHKQQGASLIEVMVALLVLAIGTLGVLSMQVNSVKLNQNAYLYSQAANIANDIYEAMVITPAEFRSMYTLEGVASDSACNPECSSPSEIVAWYMYNWEQNIGNVLPEGTFDIQETSNDNEYAISVTFSQRALDNPEDSNALTTRYALVARF